MKAKLIFKKLKSGFKKLVSLLSPGKKAMKGAAIGMLIFACLVFLILPLEIIQPLGFITTFVFALGLFLILILSALLINYLLEQLSELPTLFKRALFFTILVTFLSFAGGMQITLSFLAAFIILPALLGGGIWLLIKRDWKKNTLLNKILISASTVIGFAGLLTISIWYFYTGKDTEAPTNAAYFGESIPEPLQLEDPSADGPYSFQYLTYGSGNDKNREEFAEQVSIKTDSVDGSNLLTSWSGFTGKLRTKYFGFDKDALPLNARVWYPEGEGNFPLVLIVHGNHLAQDFSDGGYGYLGEFLASRGYIFASVDENFLNSSFSDIPNGLSGENGARGWLMLKHLEQWRKWNADSTSQFYNKVNMDEIALIGHSRGGEAVAIAASFNRLPFHPDNGLEKFDFNFNIRSIVGIAPVDGQYTPSNVPTPIEDVNYLLLHGSHDMDVQSYSSLKQFHRLEYSEGFDGFKAGLYIYKANHGQFNTTWGNKDGGSPYINLFNLKQLISEEDQQKIAKVYIGAFLETTLKKNKAYQPLFADHRLGKNWLPENIYLSQYEQSGITYLANYEEDIDLSTATIAGGKIVADKLSKFKEQLIKMTYSNQSSKAAYLGWDFSEIDTLIGTYTITLPDSMVLDSIKHETLGFLLADAAENASHPKKKSDKNENEEEEGEDDNANEENNESQEEEDDESEEDDKDKKKEPIDFTIQLTDQNGEIVSTLLSEYSYLQPQIEKNLMKLEFMRNNPNSEAVFSSFYLPLSSIGVENPFFDWQKLSKIEFIFNQNKKGVIILNNIGLMTNPFTPKQND